MLSKMHIYFSSLIAKKYYLLAPSKNSRKNQSLKMKVGREKSMNCDQFMQPKNKTCHKHIFASFNAKKLQLRIRFINKPFRKSIHYKSKMKESQAKSRHKLKSLLTNIKIK